MTNYGLTSEDSVKKLEENIQDVLTDNKRQRAKTSLCRFFLAAFKRNDPVVLTSWAGVVSTIVVIVTMVIFAAVSDTQRITSLYVEISIVVGFGCLMVIFCIRESYLKVNEIERLIKKLCAQLREGVNWSIRAYPDLTLPESASVSLIATYRDGHVVNLPWNLLVEGDVIILGPSRLSPARCKQLLTEAEDVPMILEAGQTYDPQETVSTESPIHVFPRELFEVIEAPIRGIIKCCYEQAEKKRPPITTTYACAVVGFVERYVIVPVFLLTVLVNIIRWKVLNEGTHDAKILVFMYQSYIILPLIPLLYPMIFLVTRYYGSCRVQYLARNEGQEVDLQCVLQHCFDILIHNLPDCLPRTIDLVSTLGSITTFCCVDKEGILCHPNPIPEKIFFFKQQQAKKNTAKEFVIAATEGPGNSKGDIVIDTEKEGLSNCIEVMTLSPDPKSSVSVQFDDIDWELHKPSLRPMGANILLNSPCSCPIRTLREDDFIRHMSLSANTRPVSNGRCCLCPLAEYLGLEEEMWKAYRTKQRRITYMPVSDTLSSGPQDFFLSIVKEKHVPQMVSSVVNAGKYGISQVFTQGSGDIVLETCTDFWNGDEICLLKDADRKKALNFFRRMNITRNCLAFAYRPIFDEKAMKEDQLHMDVSKEGKSGGKLRTKRLHKHGRNDTTYEELLDAVLLEDFTFKQGELKKQIFLGMITMTHALKEDLMGMIEQLNFAGIRFVHFSYENELLSRVFCQRLGLETGWNCHISLAESSLSTIADEFDEEDDESSIASNTNTDPLLDPEHCSSPDVKSSIGKQGRKTDNNVDGNSIDGDNGDDGDTDHSQPYFEPYFLSNRSKLPKGIHNMRTHLSEIDDVPLLVPLFTDCNAAAVQEMMHIMQDYSDVVCCIGSSLNARNHCIFEQSDVSISMEPLNFMPCSVRNKGLDDVKEESLEHGNHLKDPIALSASLNTITCSLHVQRNGRFPIGAMINDARRFTKGCKSAFMYMLSSLVSLTLLQMFSCVLMLPPPMSGLNIIWLSFVVVPLFALSLIGSPADKNLMKMLTGKRRNNVKLKNEILEAYAKHFFPAFVLNCLFISCVLYPWLLFTFCVEGSERSHWFHGSSTTNWKNFENGYFYMIHDVIVFYITLSFAVLSVTFVDRTQFIWKKYPTRSKNWCLAVVAGLLLEVLRTFCSYQHWRSEHDELRGGISDIPLAVYITTILWLLVMLVLSEFSKRCYIRDYKRFQKRERLKFDTKLGMNSPV